MGFRDSGCGTTRLRRRAKLAWFEQSPTKAPAKNPKKGAVPKKGTAILS